MDLFPIAMRMRYLGFYLRLSYGHREEYISPMGCAEMSLPLGICFRRIKQPTRCKRE